MRVLLLSQWFQPEPFFKGLPLARALRDRGHDVEVLTGFPHYPGGRFYPGYRLAPWRREVRDGIVVNRVPLYPSHDRNALRRMASYFSFGASAASIGPWRVRTPDVVYVYNLVTLGWAARFFRRWRGARIVLDVQDLWPESVMNSGMLRNRLLLGILRRWCDGEYRSFDRLIVQSPGFKRNLSSRGLDENRIDIVYNWCDEAALAPPSDEGRQVAESRPAGPFRVLFAGTMGIVQALGPVLETARRCHRDGPAVDFTFVGDGVEKASLQKAAADLPNVHFLERRAPADMGPLVSEADALLVHLKNEPIFRITIPSKIQAYLYMGKPILCGVLGDAAELVVGAGAGISFAPEDPASLREAIGRMRDWGPARLREMGEKGRRYYLDNLSMATGIARIEAVFKKALGGRSSPAEGARPNSEAPPAP